MIGVSANFMVGMLLGDFPADDAQRLGRGVLRLHLAQGKPSSFPILFVTFALTMGIMYWPSSQVRRLEAVPSGRGHGRGKIPDKSSPPSWSWLRRHDLAMSLRDTSA